MASGRPLSSLRADPVIEVARRGAVRLAVAGGSLMTLASAVQVITGDSTGVVTLVASAPTTVVAILLTRKQRPNVVLLVAMIATIALASEVYAALDGNTEYVAGIGSEVVVLGLGILAVFVARERPRLVAVGFLTGAVAVDIVSQVHLNGWSLEITTDVMVIVSVMGTLMYLVIRVLDSLSESQTRFSDLASTIPVATMELEMSRAIARIESWRREPDSQQARRWSEMSAELLGLMSLSFANDMARQLVAGFGNWREFAVGPNAAGVQREMEEALRAILRGRESGYGEYTATRLDGTSQDFIYRWAISRQPGSGKPTRMVLAATDVTQLRQTEAALERQLRERDQFVASVSHELRTPLTSVLGLTEELVNRPHVFDAAEQAELLGIVHAETQDVVDIVEDLLVTARAESGQLQVNVTTCDLAAEMARVSELMGGALLPGPASVAVGADPVRLRQVLRNLVSNAHRHGGADIRMGVTTDADMASFEIRDDGAPLPPGERERIFEAYERSAEGGVVGSVGLGLHVARLLARLMGGDLTYDHDGNDSIFRLTLPLVAAVTAGSPAD